MRRCIILGVGRKGVFFSSNNINSCYFILLTRVCAVLLLLQWKSMREPVALDTFSTTFSDDE
jgi:hypothetical protein